MSKFYRAFFLALTIVGCASGPESMESAELPDDESALVDDEGFAKPTLGLSQKRSSPNEKQDQQQKSNGSATSEPGQSSKFPFVVTVTRTTPVFSKPSARSRIIADVTRSTSLIARRESPQGQWLFVEDEDGNQGWIPEKRTNKKIILEKASAKPADANVNLATSNVVSFDDISQEANTRFKENEVFDSSETAQGIDSLAVSILGLKLEKGGYGLGYSFLTPLVRDTKSPDRVQRVGFELGFQRGWTPGTADQVNHTLYTRMRMLAQTEGQYLGTGPDLGVFYQLQNKKWGPSIGYSLGLVPAWNSGFTLLMRGGFEWPDWNFGFTIGVEMGWVF